MPEAKTVKKPAVKPATPASIAHAAKPASKPVEKAPAGSSGLIAAVRVRGEEGVKTEIRLALQCLRLQRTNVCVIIPDTKIWRGQLRKCKDYITYGTITNETKQLLEEKRGVKKADGTLKPFYRLNPPRHGFGRKGVKKAFTEGGALGERGTKMDDLIQRMV
jgi:large subunit ribosomal protein L30